MRTWKNWFGLLHKLQQLDNNFLLEVVVPYTTQETWQIIYTQSFTLPNYELRKATIQDTNIEQHLKHFE